MATFTQTPRQKKASPNLALSARIATKQGREILTFLLSVMRNTTGFEETSDRIKAADLLLQRGWGKAPVEIHIEVEETISLKSYSLDQLLSMKSTMDKLEASEPLMIEAEVIGESDDDEARGDND